jgi:hypothetical protein
MNVLVSKLWFQKDDQVPIMFWLSLPTKSLSGSANRQISLRKQQAIIVVCSSSFVFFQLVALQNETQQRRRSYSKKIQFMQYKHNNVLPGF